MRIRKFCMALAVGGWCAAGTAWAQTTPDFGADALEPAAYRSYYDQQEKKNGNDPVRSPSDEPQVQPQVQAQPVKPPSDSFVLPSTAGCATCAPAACGPSCCAPPSGCCDEEVCRLFSCCCLDNAGITIGGWIQQGFTWNPDNPTNPGRGDGNLPVLYNYRSNEYMLNQAYLFAEKATGGCGWSLGGRVDALYGTDYFFVQSRGLEVNGEYDNKWNAERGNGLFGTALMGLAMPQLYAEVGYNDELKVRVGHFYRMLGYEQVMAPNNFFYSHSLNMSFGYLQTHTGAVAIYQPSCDFSVYGGVHRGWNNWEDDNDNLSILGGFTAHLTDSTSLSFGFTGGDEAGFIDGDTYRYRHAFILAHQLDCKTQWVLEADYAHQDRIGVFGEDAEWYSFVNYLFYDLNCQWRLGLRYEWMNSDDGVPIGFLGGRWQELTVGVNYKHNANVLVRSELRYDWIDRSDFQHFAPSPYDDLSDSNMFTWATDLILQF